MKYKYLIQIWENRDVTENRNNDESQILDNSTIFYNPKPNKFKFRASINQIALNKILEQNKIIVSENNSKDLLQLKDVILFLMFSF